MFDVYLYIYDLSFGLARSVSPLLLGKRIDGIWHTGIVVHGNEYFFGGHGISLCSPCGTGLGEPCQKLHLGQTSVSQADLHNYLEQLSRTLFKGDDYQLLDHNCNTFSNHLAGYLVNRQIPSYILDLPAQVESSPLGSTLRPAMALLSSGLNNVPQFGLSEQQQQQQLQQAQPENDADAPFQHTFEEMCRLFHPILFDEPLPLSLSQHRIKLLWSDVSEESGKAKFAADLFRMTTESNRDEYLSPEHFSMLALDTMQTDDQCRAVLELFRLAVWRNSNLLTAMLTDPRRNLHRLVQCAFPATRPEDLIELHAAQAKFLANCIGLTCFWPLAVDDEFKLPLSPMVHLCLLLLDHEDHRLIASKPNPVFPEHRQIGLALGHNLAMCKSLSPDDALELGSYLLHLAVTQKKSYKQPIEAIYLLRTIYFLVIRFPMVADLARSLDLGDCLTAVLSETTDSAVTTSTSHSNPESNKLFEPPSVNGSASIDYFIAIRLIDFLSTLD